MAPEDLKALGLRVTEELFNQGDLAVVDEVLDPGYTEHVVTEEEAISVDQLMDRITALRRACPDLYAHTEAQVVEGDTLVQRLTVTATDAGGRTTVRVLDVSRVGPDGRFVERWTLDDPFTVLRELGRLTVGSTARDERVPVNRPPVADHPQGSSAPWTWVAVGAVCGLAWSAALRGYMVELVGSASAFTWSGTFGALLLPGAVTGGLLGWAEYLRRTGPPRGWRWLALAPLALAVAPMLLPGAVTTLARFGRPRLFDPPPARPVARPRRTGAGGTTPHVSD
jgi:predicted ester cyclase